MVSTVHYAVVTLLPPSRSRTTPVPAISTSSTMALQDLDERDP